MADEPTVFVAQETPIPLDGCRSFGHPVVMVPRENGAQRDYDGYKRLIKIALSRATDHDWVLPTGDPVVIGLAIALFGQKTGRVRVLRWDKRMQEYVPVDVPFLEGLQGIEIA